MKSKITIDLDEDNQPVIKISKQFSEDVRDKMVVRFLESFGFESTECKILFNYPSPGEYTIRPVPSKPIEGTVTSSAGDTVLLSIKG